MSVEAETRTGPPLADPESAAADVPGDAVLTAGAGLFAALRRFAIALLALVAAEAQVLRASVGLLFLSGVALVAFAVSLWACVVALIGWALAAATGSIGIALGILVALHLVLVAATWLAIKRAIHHASFPHARAEFGALRSTLRRDLEAFQRTSTPNAGEDSTP